MNSNTFIGKITKIKNGNDEFQHIVDLFLKLNNSEVILKDTRLQFNQNGKIVEFSLRHNTSLNDGFTETYETEVGFDQFINFIYINNFYDINKISKPCKIRIVKPIGLALINSIQQNGCEDLFTIGSNADEDGFAISFILTSLANKKILEIKYQNILDETIESITQTIAQSYHLATPIELRIFANRLNTALTNNGKNISDYTFGDKATTILDQFGFSLDSLKSRSKLHINYTPIINNAFEDLPNLVSDFKETISFWFRKLSNYLDDRNKEPSVGYNCTLVTYIAIETMINYHSQTSGILPIKIVDSILKQATQAYKESFVNVEEEVIVDMIKYINEFIKTDKAIEKTQNYFKILEKY